MKKFTDVMKTVGKVLRFLLIKLGLWIPTVFTLLFFIVLAVTNTPFRALSGVFVFGLVTTCVFAAAFVFLTAFRKFDKKFSRDKKRKTENYVAEPKKKQDKVEFVKGAEDEEFAAGRDEQKPLFDGRDASPAEPARASDPDDRSDNRSDRSAPDNRTERSREPVRETDSPRDSRGYNPYDDYDNAPRSAEPRPYGDPNRDDRSSDRSDRDRGFLPYRSVNNEQPADANTEFLSYGEPAPQGGRGFDSAARGSDPGRRGFRVQPDGDEQPRIFRTRMDPDLLIYEYSDRLDFYRVEPDGRRTLVSSEKKSPR